MLCQEKSGNPGFVMHCQKWLDSSSLRQNFCLENFSSKTFVCSRKLWPETAETVVPQFSAPVKRLIVQVHFKSIPFLLSNVQPKNALLNPPPNPETIATLALSGNETHRFFISTKFKARLYLRDRLRCSSDRVVR
jgi:hypothetical protein